MGKILIAGASGFVGSYLAEHLLNKGNHVIGIGTSKIHPILRGFQRFQWISADTTTEGVWQSIVPQVDTVINLTGRSIFNYWTARYQQQIYDSRILTTRNIVNAMRAGRPSKLLSTSAAGYYGDAGDRLLSEQSQPGDDFLSRVCVDWEKEALRAADKGVEVSIMRLGVVLGNGGGLAKMGPVFKLFLGGPLGSGEQWFPWVHIQDLAGAADSILEKRIPGGIYNFVGAEPVQQKRFARELGKVLGRPAFMPAPQIIVKALMGKLGSSLLQSQKAVPEKLLQAGYTFLFPRIGDALNDILVK